MLYKNQADTNLVRMYEISPSSNTVNFKIIYHLQAFYIFRKIEVSIRYTGITSALDIKVMT